MLRKPSLLACLTLFCFVGWCSSAQGQSVFVSPTGNDNNTGTSLLTELIRVDDGTVDGNANVGSPVTNITFDGLTFTGGDFSAMQSDDVTVQHDWMVVDEPDALLRIRNAENIIVRNSTFTKSGGTGIRVDRYGQNVQITGNTLSNLGRGGIGLVGRGPGYGDVNKDNSSMARFMYRDHNAAPRSPISRAMISCAIICTIHSITPRMTTHSTATAIKTPRATSAT